MPYNLKIPPNKKYKFAEPLDKLISGTREETLPKVEKIIRNYEKSNRYINFYIVGDIVTKDFLENPYLRTFIKLCIIDEKTQRKRFYLDSEDFFEEILEIENPEGTIQKKFWALIRDVIKSKKKTLIKIITGEEDLLVLPLILELPLEQNIKNFVFYGQPPITDAEITIPEGIVIIDVKEKIQNKVRKFISFMKKY